MALFFWRKKKYYIVVGRCNNERLGIFSDNLREVVNANDCINKLRQKEFFKVVRPNK